MQLAAERALHDLGELRSLVEQAALALWAAGKAWTVLLSEVRDASPSGSLSPTVKSAIGAAQDATLPLADYVVRLELRLGQGEAASQAFHRGWEALSALPPDQLPLRARYDADLERGLS